MNKLLEDIRQCTICKSYLPFAPRPIVQVSVTSKILIIGQAPSLKVQQSGIPWNDKSGDNLRSWLGIDKSVFYDAELVAVIPMGFCYPGNVKGGDLPPRRECAPLWHDQLLQHMPRLQLVLLVGQYAQHYYLGKSVQQNLTETVHHFKEYLPNYFPLPHPSPRNNIWQAKNQWFKQDVLPVLKDEVMHVLTA